MKLMSGKKVPKKVSFGHEKTKVSRVEALSDVFEKPILGFIMAVALLIAWGDNQETFTKLPSFFFGILIVTIIILSILRPLAFVKKLELVDGMALALSALEAAVVGMVVGFCREQVAVGILTCGLLAGGLQHPFRGVLSRLTAATVVAVSYPISVAMRVAVLLSCFDILAMGWNYYLKRKRENKQGNLILAS